ERVRVGGLRIPEAGREQSVEEMDLCQGRELRRDPGHHRCGLLSAIDVTGIGAKQLITFLKGYRAAPRDAATPPSIVVAAVVDQSRRRDARCTNRSTRVLLHGCFA